VCFGSSRRALGVAALALGKLDLAVEHFAAAVAANERIAHRPAAAQARAELALALLRRAGRDDLARGRMLLQQAIAEGEEAEMSGLVVRWREAAARTESGLRFTPDTVRMTRFGAGWWRVTHGGEVATVPDRVGMRYLAQLVANPDQCIPAVALVVDAPLAAGRPEPLLDRAALAALRERIQQIRRQPVRSSGEEEELAMLTKELVHASGLGRRVRSFADVPERARIAVTKAIKRAIDEISAANPVVGRHLALRVETGTACRYRFESARAG
jgi:hypothetical protein